MKEIAVGTAVSKGPGIAKGTLEVGAYPDGTPIAIPVVILRGATEGPVLWLNACVHGNEYCGTFTIHALLRRLDPANLSGTVVALPALNLPAFQKNQRMSPFEGFSGGDLNRCFPGRANGTVTEQMAHAIYDPLKEHADYLVDFHTAITPDTRWLLFSDYGGRVSEVGERMARAFGYRDILPAKADLLQGSTMHVAGHDGIPVLIVETGGIGSAFEHAAVDQAADRMVNVMRALGMVEGAVTEHGPLNFFSSFDWICATGAGLYERTVRCGDTITAGQVIGHFYNTFGDRTGDAHAPSSGIVLAAHNGPVLARGELLIHIGLDPRPR
jgi:predicted deacylase